MSIFDNAAETLEAISVVRKHLADGWITEGCREHRSFGCISCHAARLDDDLRLLEEELRDDLVEDAAPLDNPPKSVEETDAYSDAHRAATVPAVPPD